MGNAIFKKSKKKKGPRSLVIVGPSGVGKGTLVNKLLEEQGQEPRFGFSCSHTTRKPREGEVEGVHYHFTTVDEFEKGIAAGKFLENAKVHENYYGTSIDAVKTVTASGKCCILDIDVQGARQVKASDLDAIIVFISPPSLEELEKRLLLRGTETQKEIQVRSSNAKIEMESLDDGSDLYDYVIVNDSFDSCYSKFREIAYEALGTM